MMMGFMAVITLQALVIVVDEFYCHFRRELPRWERWGHPLDTIFLLLPLALLTFIPDLSVGIYSVVAIFSCLFITKDEWVHAKYCTAFENWLHAILFILHPLVLIFAWWVHQENFEILLFVLPPMVLFLMYQLIYWNFYDSKSIRS